MKTRWYKDSVVYQIYPRSFCDSNGDGIGDLRGIIEKIPYLKELGVDAVWLSPCYKSPNDDNGYDISDYRDIMDEFGTMADWEEMTAKLHKNGIKLIMDLVVNHSSDEHKWFIESKKGKDNPYSDYYIWRDGTGKDKKDPPCSWGACFGGSAWEYCEERGQFYLHLFSKKQPDLNWDNPKVRQEVADICNFWLEKGVDGFRCDVITFISKPADLYHDNPGSKVVVGPHWKEYIRELSERSWDRFDTLIVGEAAGIDFDRAAEITDENAHLLDMLFHFEHVGKVPVCAYSQKSTNLRKFKSILNKWQTLPEGSWPAVYYENHDQPRSLPRFAPSGKLRETAAKSLALSLLFQKGTAFIYQGQELGMTNCDFKQEDYRDIEAVNEIKSWHSKPFSFVSVPAALRFLNHYSRDHARTPMQWSKEKNAGFTSGEPWLKVNPNYAEINAAEQQNRADSVLSFYRGVLKIRKEYIDIVRDGRFVPVDTKNKDVFAYARELDGKILLAVCSLSPKKAVVNIPEEYLKKGSKLILTNSETHTPLLTAKMRLLPCECGLWLLK